MNYLPILLFWGLAIWGMLSHKPVLLYLFFATFSIGAFAAVPTALTGGMTLTATPVLAILLILRTFADRAGPAELLSLMLRPERMMLLFLFWLVAAVTTLFMPRLFAGDILVVPVRASDLNLALPLRPTAQNFSQFTYISISVFTAFAFARMLQSATMRQHAYQAICLGGAVTAITGLLDYASQFVPITPLLAPFRTASYALATEVQVFGSKRVVGLMPEASAFGSRCLEFACAIYFFRRVIIDRQIREIGAPVVLALLALCIWQAKSSGTYVGFALLVVMAACEWVLRANANPRTGYLYRRGLGGEMSVVFATLIGIGTLLILFPGILQPATDLIDRMVLKKGSSDSFVQRGFWRSVSWQGLLDSRGFGIGLGASRSSSSFVAIAAGTGILGAALYYGFVLQTLLRQTFRATVETQLVVAAVRFSFVPTFIVTMFVGDADFGPMFAFGFGITTAVAINQTRLLAWRGQPARRKPVQALSV